MPPQETIARRRSLDTVSVFALLTTLVLAVVLITPTIATPLLITKTFVLAIGTLLALAFYILARLTRGNVIFPPVLLVGALWLPFLAYLLSGLFAGVPFSSAFWGTALEPDTVGFVLMLSVLGTLTAFALRGPEHYKLFFKVGAYTLGAVLLVQLVILVIGQFAPNTVSPASAIIGSFQDLAFLIGLGVITTLVTFRSFELSQKTRRLLTAGLVVGLFLLALANATLVWILVALTALGLFVETIMRHGSKVGSADLEQTVLVDEMPLESGEGNRSLVLPLSVLAVSLFFLIGGALANKLDQSLHVNLLDVRPSWQSTFGVAKKTYATSAVLGSGPNTFGVEWLKHRDASLNGTVFWSTDFTSGIGFIPSSFVTTGIVGVIAWLAFLGLFLWLGFRMILLRTPQDPYVRFTAVTSFVASLYLFTLAVCDLPNAVLLVLAFVSAGLFASTMRFATGGQQWGIAFSRSPRIGFVIVFVLTILLLSSVVLGYTLVGRYIAATTLTNAEVALNAGSLGAADQAVTTSLSFAPSVAGYQVQAGIANARLNTIAASTTMERGAAQKAYQDALSAGINAALTATNIAPNDYQSWLVLGNLYAQAVPLGVEGSYDSAKSAFQKAEALNPTNPQIPYILAQLDIANKDNKAAEADLKAAIELKQDYTPAIFLLSQLEVQDGNIKDALNSALAAAYFTPNDPNILFQVGVLYAAQNDFTNAAAALLASVTANPQYANARYLLAAVYAKQGKTEDALAQMKAIAAMSDENAQAVASQLTSLEAGKNPFPANLLSASSTPVQ